MSHINIAINRLLKCLCLLNLDILLDIDTCCPNYFQQVMVRGNRVLQLFLCNICCLTHSPFKLRLAHLQIYSQNFFSFPFSPKKSFMFSLKVTRKPNILRCLYLPDVCCLKGTVAPDFLGVFSFLASI